MPTIPKSPWIYFVTVIVNIWYSEEYDIIGKHNFGAKALFIAHYPVFSGVINIEVALQDYPLPTASAELLRNLINGANMVLA